MLNRRIKSILASGLIMLGMTGNVFGEEAKTEEYYNKLNEKIIATYMDQMAKSGFTKFDGDVRIIDESFYMTEKDWQDFVTAVNTNPEDGIHIMEYDALDDGRKWFEVHTDPDFNEDITDTDVIRNDPFEVVIVTYATEEDIEFKGIDDIILEALPKINVNTGQALSIGGLGISTIAAIGLLINNKKRKNNK